MNNCKIAQYEIYDGYIAEKNRWTANVKWHILEAYLLERMFDSAQARRKSLPPRQAGGVKKGHKKAFPVSLAAQGECSHLSAAPCPLIFIIYIL